MDKFVRHSDNSVELLNSHYTSEAKYEVTKILPPSQQNLNFLIPRSVGEIESIGLEFTIKNKATVKKDNLTLDELFDRWEIKNGDQIIETIKCKDEYRIISANSRNKDYYEFGKGYYMINNKTGFVELDLDAAEEKTQFIPLFSILEKTHVNPSLMDQEIYIHFHIKTIANITLKDVKLVVWYNNNPCIGKLSTRHRIVRAEREYTTVSTGANQDVNITLHSGIKDCLAIVVMLKDSTGTSFLKLDNIKTMTLKINECCIVRNFHELTLYAQEDKYFALIRLTSGYNDFENVLKGESHKGGKEIPYGNNKSLSFNMGTVIAANKNIDVSILYFGYNTLCFDKRNGINILK